MLDLAGHHRSSAVPTPNGHYEQEKICRRAPCEPLTFASGHEHGQCIDSAPIVSQQYAETIHRLLAGMGDSSTPALTLAVILP